MVQAPGGLRLVLEAADQLRLLAVAEQLLADRLERDDALDVRIERLVDDAHRAFAEDAVDAVFAELFDHARPAHSSSIFMALARLVRMRPNERASTDSSSLPFDFEFARR